MRPIRVLMVINHFHPFVGGAERQAQKLAKALIGRGLDVEVLTARHAGLSKRDVIDGIPVQRHRVFHLRLGARKLFYTLFYVPSVLFHLLRHRKSFDIVHVHQGMYPAFACSLAARLLGKSSIVKVGNSAERFDLLLLKEKPIIGRFMAKSMCRHADRFVAISTHISNDLKHFGVPPEKILMIPNGVDIPGEPAGWQRNRADESPFVVGYIGTLSRHKNIEVLLQAFSRLPPEVRQKSQLLVVGDGPERARLETCADHLGIRCRTTFCGYQTNAAEWFEKLDCFVSTSLVEGLSNSLLEAMAHGKACIVSRGVSGNVDLIEPGENGFLVDPMDHSQLAELLCRLATDRALARRLGTNARSTVSRDYAIPAIVDKYIRLYQSLR